MTSKDATDAPRRRTYKDFFADQAVTIDDRRFNRQLHRVRGLKQFLADERVVIADDEIEGISLGALDRLRFGRWGRPPTEAEWRLLDEKLARLTNHLTPELRRSIRLVDLRGYFRTLPIVFLLSAIVALFVGFTIVSLNVLPADPALAVGSASASTQLSLTPSASILFFVTVLLWTLALGGLGAVAFLGTSLLNQSRVAGAAVLPKITDSAGQPRVEPIVIKLEPGDIDLTDANLLTTRIVVGILFAFLLALPFAYKSLSTILLAFVSFGGGSTGKPLDIPISDLPTILSPFVLGFSTTVVLAIMDRFVVTIRTIFGLEGPAKAGQV